MDGWIMPYYRTLITWLRVAPQRLNAAGEMELSVAEAGILRACDFLTAAPGIWKVPPLPTWLVRSCGLPSRLADAPLPSQVDTRAAPTVATVASDGDPSPVAGSRHTLTLPVSIRIVTLPEWLAHHATRDELRVLATIARHPTDRLRKRALQQRLHRLPALRLNQALTGLVDVGLVIRDSPWLETTPAVHQALRD